jgi:hypothetical protein
MITWGTTGRDHRTATIYCSLCMEPLQYGVAIGEAGAARDEWAAKHECKAARAAGGRDE